MSVGGIFPDVVGLSYRCGSNEGITTDSFTYQYEPGTNVTFSIGDLVLGESRGKPHTTVSDLVPVDTATFDPKVINRARLLFSLSAGQGFEAPITIDNHVRVALPPEGPEDWLLNLSFMMFRYDMWLVNMPPRSTWIPVIRPI